MHHMSKQKFES